jgi:hypothetical protein
MQDSQDKETSRDEIRTEYKRENTKKKLIWGPCVCVVFVVIKTKGKNQDRQDKEKSTDEVQRENTRF